MVVVMQEGAPEAQIQGVINKLMEMGFDIHRSTGEVQTVLGAVGAKPDFDTREIELLDGVLAESWLFEIVGAEGGAKRRSIPSRVNSLKHVAALRFQSLEEGIAIVNHANVQDAQVQALDQVGKRRIVLVKVHVNVNRCQGGKACEIASRRTARSGIAE